MAYTFINAVTEMAATNIDMAIGSARPCRRCDRSRTSDGGCSPGCIHGVSNQATKTPDDTQITTTDANDRYWANPSPTNHASAAIPREAPARGRNHGAAIVDANKIAARNRPDAVVPFSVKPTNQRSASDAGNHTANALTTNPHRRTPNTNTVVRSITKRKIALRCPRSRNDWRATRDSSSNICTATSGGIKP